MDGAAPTTKPSGPHGGTTADSPSSSASSGSSGPIAPDQAPPPPSFPLASKLQQPRGATGAGELGGRPEGGMLFIGGGLSASLQALQLGGDAGERIEDTEAAAVMAAAVAMGHQHQQYRALHQQYGSRE